MRPDVGAAGTDLRACGGCREGARCLPASTRSGPRHGAAPRGDPLPGGGHAPRAPGRTHGARGGLSVAGGRRGGREHPGHHPATRRRGGATSGDTRFRREEACRSKDVGVNMPDCVFCKIVAGAIPSQRVYEDDQVLAIRDINPQAPVHVLLLPKRHIASVLEITERHDVLLRRIVLAAGAIAQQEGIAERGFRLLTNTGRGGGPSPLPSPWGPKDGMASGIGEGTEVPNHISLSMEGKG